MSDLTKKLAFFSFFFLFTILLHAEKYSVHEFTVPPAMQQRGLTGWWAAEKMESFLARTRRFEVITRARIAQVLREQSLNSGAIVKNEPIRTEKADFVISGRFHSTARYMSLTLSVIRSDNAAICRSFELSLPNTSGLETANAQRLLEDAAAFLVMSPGAMLVQAMENRAAGNLRRTSEIMTFLMLNFPLAELDKRPMPPEPPELSGKGVAELFDTGARLWAQGAAREAEPYFYAARRRLGVPGFSALLTESENALKKHDRQFEQQLSAARREYESLLKMGKGEEAISFCDNEIAKLLDYIRHSDVKLLRTELQLLEAELERFQTYRDKIFSGPTVSRSWELPELGIRLIPVPAGEFLQNRHSQEGTPRKVRLSRPFWIAAKEVSVGDYVTFLNSATLGLGKSERYRYDREIRYQDPRCPIDQTFNFRRGYGPDYPMSCVSWRGAKLYVDWLNERERKAGRIPPGYEYRLPTEAEWDWAARGGSSLKDCPCCIGAAMAKAAVTEENSNRQVQKTGSRMPNSLGLFDMYGNLWEWCNDWYSELSGASAETDPVGPSNNADDCKVIRGGSFWSSSSELNCGTRREADYRSGRSNIGFRIVCAPVL